MAKHLVWPLLGFIIGMYAFVIFNMIISDGPALINSGFLLVMTFFGIGGAVVEVIIRAATRTLSV